MRPFNIVDTHGILSLPSSHVRADSQELNWSSIYVSSQTETPFEGIFEARDLLVVLFRDGVYGTEKRGGRGNKVSAPAGAMRIIPGGSKLEVSMQSTCNTVHFYVRKHVLEEVALDIVDGDPRRAEIVPAMVPSDPILRQLLEAGEAAMLARDQTSLYADCLSQAVAARLLQSHSVARLKRFIPGVSSGPVSREVSTAIDYMQINIEQNIGLAELARASNCSPSHLSRLFGLQVGMPPHRYLMGMRVTKAKLLLETTMTSIAEIAVMCGFTHQEHLTRLFRRYHNASPGAYRSSVRS
jgi:AraC family transcriptional regulator